MSIHLLDFEFLAFQENWACKFGKKIVDCNTLWLQSRNLFSPLTMTNARRTVQVWQFVPHYLSYVFILANTDNLANVYQG